MKYWVERWSELRKKEMVEYPKEFLIHEDYTKMWDEEELRSGFADLFGILQQIYEDASMNAEAMQLPLYDMDVYRYLSKEENVSRSVSYKYAKVLYSLGYTGEVTANGDLCVDASRCKELCKKMQLTSVHTCFEVLVDYGFIFTGLLKGKLKDGCRDSIIFPHQKHGKGNGTYCDFFRKCNGTIFGR